LGFGGDVGGEPFGDVEPSTDALEAVLERCVDVDVWHGDPSAWGAHGTGEHLPSLT
jgi:hypothetical protein